MSAGWYNIEIEVKGHPLLLMSWYTINVSFQGRFTRVERRLFESSPDLFCIVEFDLRPLLDEFGVLLQVFDTPLRMLLQVVKLILQDGRKAIDQFRLSAVYGKNNQIYQ